MTPPTVDWFDIFAAGGTLSPGVVQELRDVGFAVIPGPVVRMAELATAYDAAMTSADPSDRSTSATNTRVHDFVNRGPAFDPVYVHPPALEAAGVTIGRPFKLSSLLGRTLLPRTPAQDLHIDYPPDAAGWPMLGFILMVDAFRPDNGATRFVPGSHLSAAGLPSDRRAANPDQVLALGPAGTVVLYNGSVWHGHTANATDEPRRSIQGAFIRRDARAATDFLGRMTPDTFGRIGPLARSLLGI